MVNTESELLDAILMDCQMPRLRERCLAAGMTGYISKPIDRSALKQLLRKVQESI